MMYEDEGESCSAGGTTSADIAPFTVKLGDILRRRELEEGFYNDFIIKNVKVKFYKNGHSNEEFSCCFDKDQLKIDVINFFERRCLKHDRVKITEEDESIPELEYIINKNCKHHHNWYFSELKQYGIQIIFRSKDTDCYVSVYQLF